MKNYLIKIVAIAAMLLMVTFQSSAQSLDKMYIYAPDGKSQVVVLDELRKITFGEQAIELIPVTGIVKTVNFNDISVITFKEKQTSISEVKKSNIKLFVEADQVTIESDADMTAVRLFDLQGRLLKNQPTQSHSANISLSSCPAGVYIIQILGQETSVHKIIKR